MIKMNRTLRIYLCVGFIGILYSIICKNLHIENGGFQLLGAMTLGFVIGKSLRR